MPKKNKASQSDELAVFPSGSDEWVELARVKKGVLFEKHILNKGTLIHPVTGNKIAIDDNFVNTLRKNFQNNICDIVQVPLADNQNSHSEDPDRNIGEVVDIKERDGKVYAVIDARRADAAEKLGKTWLGASAMLSTNYKDTNTGERVGPTLLHVAVTNRPYVTGLEDYKEIISASNVKESDVVVYQTCPDDEEVKTSADSLIDETLEASSPTEENTMTRDELIAALLEHGIDVEALQAAADEAEANAALSNELAEKLAETLELSNSAVDSETLVGAIAELHNEKVSLSARLEGLERAQAEHVVNGLVSAGFVEPARKDAFVELRLSNPEMFEKLVPSEPIVKLGVMTGSEPNVSDAKDELNIDAEIARLTAGFSK